MCLHLKKKRSPWVKGFTSLPVTVSCGFTTGNINIYQLLLASDAAPFVFSC